MRTGIPSILAMSAIVLLGGALAQQTGGSTPAGPKMTMVHRADFEGVQLSGEYTMTMATVQLDPGAKSAVHAHGGHEMILVTNGEVTVQYDHDGSTKVVRAGEKLLIPANTFMQVQNNTKEKANFIVAFATPREAAFSTPKN